MKLTVWHLGLGFVAGILLGLLPYAITSLENLAHWGEALAGIGILFAASTYFWQLETARKASVADQINMFRTEILRLNTENLLENIDVDKNYTVSTVPIEEFTLEWLEKHSPVVAQTQHDFNLKLINHTMKRFDLSGHGVGQAIAFDKKIGLLNALEELALQITLNNTINDPDLTPIKKAFTAIVEENVRILITLMSEKTFFVNLKKVYLAWRPTLK